MRITSLLEHRETTKTTQATTLLEDSENGEAHTNSIMASKTKCRKTRILVVGISLALLVLVLLMFVPWLVITNHYEKTVEPGKMKPVYTTRAFQLDGQFIGTVAMEILSSQQTSKFVSLHVYPTSPPLDVPNDLTLHIKYIVNLPKQVACSQFYLNSGSVVNVTFCAADQTRWLVIRGDDEIIDYDNIKSPLRVVFDETFESVDCRSGSASGRAVFTYVITDSDQYRFCFETFTFVNVTNIHFSGVSMQYNLSSMEGSKCMPSDREYSTCVLGVPHKSSATAVVELTNTTSTSSDIKFSIQTSVRHEVLWLFTGPAVAVTVLVIFVPLSCCVWRSTRKEKPRTGSGEGRPMLRTE